MECQPGSQLIGYTCVPNDSKVVSNCYSTHRSTNLTCIICKFGYSAYFGECLPVKQVANDINFSKKDCNSPIFLS